ncbi:MAG: hypothetical protein KKG64_05015, partial [Firmicutes bacterium]|nr:hypothetical protein [Bacillota bacterium]
YNTKSNIVLPTTSMTLTITWSSGNAAVLSSAGVIVRPVYGEADSTVILTATIGSETREFIITVLAIIEKPAELILQEAQDALLLSGISNGVAADIVLPATVGTEGVTVTWTSDTPASITGAGVVVRQPENVTVILTATLHLGELTLTKEFEVVVLSFAPFTVVADFAAAIALGDNSYVKVADVTVVGVSTDGYMLFDGTTLIFVYTGGLPPVQVVDGAVFTVTGMVDYYYGVYQLSGTADTNMPVILVASEATADVITPRVIATSISDYIATLPTTYTAVAPFIFEYITITTKVRVQNSTNYGTFLVNTDHDGTDINSDANSPFTTDALMIYYKSNMAAFIPYDGLEVTLNVFLYSLRTDRNIFTVIFTGGIEDIQTTLDDAGIVGAVKTVLTASFDAEYTVETTIDLPTVMLGTTIVWDTASEYVNLTTGLVTMPVADGQIDVTLTGTLTRNDATDTVTITFKVGRLSIITILDVINAASNAKIRTVGIVTTSEYYRTFFIQDATGGIAIYTSNAEMLATLTANLGKEVEVFGSRTSFNGMRQIAPTAITLVGDATMPTAVNVDAVLLNATDMLVYQGQLVEMTGLYVSSVAIDPTYGNVTITLERLAEGTKLTMKWDSRKALSTEAAATLAAIAVGDFYDVVNPLAWYNNPYFYFTSSTVLTAATATDADLVALDVKELVIPTEISTNQTLSLPATGTNGSAITWASNNDVVITIDGVVTVPVDKVTVILTATLILNSETKEVTFSIEVGLSDLDKIDLDVAELSIPAFLEDATPITASMPALGLNGSTIIWATDNATIITTAGTVTLPTVGQTIVTLTATLTLGSETKVIEFIVAVGVYTLAHSFDFGTTNIYGYVTPATWSLVDAVTAATYVIDKLGAQITSSTNAPHPGTGNEFMVIAGNKVPDIFIAYAIFNLGTTVATKVEFDLSMWSAADFGRIAQVTRAELQVKVGEDWITLIDFKDIVDPTIYKTVKVPLDGGSEFRFYVVQPSATLDVRFAIDNLKFFN